MFTLPELPYAPDALEPYIDKATMELHHGKHHQTYVDKLNAAVEGTVWADKPLEELLQNLDQLPEAERSIVRNNGGGHWNHNFFWMSMAPAAGGLPSGELHDRIVESFGSLDEFRKQFSDAAVGRFGSGWVWLMSDQDKLLITSTPNQDTPVMEGKMPLLGLDVWEHAYYLKYQNRRPEYVENWWNVVDWDAVSQRLAEGQST